ncbi:MULTISPECIES: STAS domain-containing protein [unclassified Pseudonocardia]|uniref:STAS domain-containing protein n=1 Tax=unclassified Pseudonocardia TaxID=2619320 RepID=UPI000761834F|nr:MULTISPECIES: STAS domain-containing protein [unclassified Pseudonocardia]
MGTEEPFHSGSLAIEWREVGSGVVVSVGGDIDYDTGPELREAVGTALGGPTTLLVIDLTRITFLGSAGVSELLFAEGYAREVGKQLRVVSGRDQRAVRRPLQVTRVDEMLALFDDLDTALRAPSC